MLGVLSPPLMSLELTKSLSTLFYFAIRLFLSSHAVLLTLPRSGARLPRGRGKYPEEEVDRKTRNLNTVVYCIYLRSLRRKILSRKVFSFALVKSPSRNGGITLRGVRISFLATTFLHPRCRLCRSRYFSPRFRPISISESTTIKILA